VLVLVPVEVRVDDPETVEERDAVIVREVVGELDEVREDLAETEVEPEAVCVRDSRLVAEVDLEMVDVFVLEDVEDDVRLEVLVRVEVEDAVEDFERVADFVEEEDVVDVRDCCADLVEESEALTDFDGTAVRVAVRVDEADAVGRAPITAKPRCS
jgi:hypothetical protein